MLPQCSSASCLPRLLLLVERRERPDVIPTVERRAEAGCEKRKKHQQEQEHEELLEDFPYRFGFVGSPRFFGSNILRRNSAHIAQLREKSSIIVSLMMEISPSRSRPESNLPE